MDTLYIATILAVFVAAILLVETLLAAWNAKRGPQARRIARRLKVMSGVVERQPVNIRKKQVQQGGVLGALAKLAPAQALDRLLAQAAVQLEVGQFILVSLAWGLGGFALMLLAPLADWMAFPAALAAAALPLAYVRAKRQARLRKIEAQLPEALDLISRALRAGHAFPSSLQMVANEMSDPIAGEFRLTFDEVNYGVPMNEAMAHLAERLPGTDVGYFVVAVTLQRETGGDLTEVLGNISHVVRERLKLQGQVRSLSAEGRLSAWILGLMPFCLTGILFLVNPKFIRILWEDPAGRSMLGVMLFVMAIGVLWMRKLIRIHV